MALAPFQEDEALRGGGVFPRHRGSNALGSQA